MNIHKLYSWINLRGANPPPPPMCSYRNNLYIIRYVINKKKSLKIRESSTPPRIPLQNSGRTVATPLPSPLPPPHPTLAPLVEATHLSFSMLSSGNKMDSLASTVLQDRHSDRLTNLYSNV